MLLRMGPFGPLVLGIADSSFLFLPFGNDILLVVLIARNHHLAYEYVPMAAVGSVIGIFLLDLVARKGGEAGLEKIIKNKKRFDYLKKKMDERAAYMITLACVAPPPFPFTPVIAAASAFEYPRPKLLGVAFVARLVRFSIVAVLATIFGREILSVVKSSAFFWTMVGFIVLCAAGSAYSIYGWVQRSRKPKAKSGD
jgi:membrane protein YqaA with SNARE-associated domain